MRRMHKKKLILPANSFYFFGTIYSAAAKSRIFRRIKSEISAKVQFRSLVRWLFDYQRVQSELNDLQMVESKTRAPRSRGQKIILHASVVMDCHP
ncbi:MAG: hypothetical protein GXO74_04700 [Calditrichaeota bacterium]|nr:hypothetical protein [Calditrichota bacterium]